AEAFVTGDVMDLPAGPLSTALGVHYQSDEIRDVPGEITLAGNAWGASSAGITEGDDNTVAVFGEVIVPLIADQPGFRNLSLSASSRYTHVASYGDDTTYKIGLYWQIVVSVRMRASQGTSFRSPALFELYLADQTSFPSQRAVDPCINWQANLDAGSISQRIADNCAADGIDRKSTRLNSSHVKTSYAV